MKKNINRIVVIALIAIMTIGLTACNKKQSSNIEDWDDADFENAVNNLENNVDDNTVKDSDATASVVSDEPAEAVFEASEEILSANLFSGKIQIFDDIFQMGGYQTVDEFVNMYSASGKYDFGELDRDSFSLAGGTWFIVERADLWKEGGKYYYYNEENNSMYNKYGRHPEIRVYVDHPSDSHVRIGDWIVKCVYPNRAGDGTASDPFWFPGGLVDGEETEYTFQTVFEDFLIPMGLKEATGKVNVDFKSEEYTCTSIGEVYLGEGTVSKGNSYYNDPSSQSIACKAGVVGEEMNLYGKYPIYKYHFYENASNGKIKFQFVNGNASRKVEDMVYTNYAGDVTLDW